MRRGLYRALCATVVPPVAAVALLAAAPAPVPQSTPDAATSLQEGDQPEGLRLKQVLAEALRRSPRLYPSQDNFDQATVSRQLAESRFNSKVTPFFSAGAEPFGPNSPSFGVNFEKMLPTGTTVRFRADSFGYSFGNDTYRDNGYTFWLNHPIIEAFGPEPRYELTNARRAVESAANQFEAAQQRLVLEVAQSYFNIVRQQRLVQASEVALDRAERLKTASEARMSVGLATRLDVLRADLFVSQALASLEDRRTALADTEDQLKLLTGRSMSQSIAVAGDDLDDYRSTYELVATAGGAIIARADDPERLDPSANALVFAAEREGAAIGASPDASSQLRPFIATALGTRIDVIEARRRVDDADRAASVATWRMLPSISLNASYRKRGVGTPLGFPFNNFYDGWSIGLSSAYTIDRSNEMAAYNSASISVRGAERALYEVQERVAAEVRRAHRAIGRSQKSIAIQSTAVEVSEEQLELAELRYERGLADNFDVVDAESNLFAAQSSLISAKVDRALAGLALDLAMGLVSPQRYMR